MRVDHDYATPEGLGHNELTTRHTYSKEECGRDDPLMSPGSRSSRGAMTPTPAPNGAKEFNIALQDQWAGWIAEATESLSELAKEKKCSSFREGNRTQCLSSEESAFVPSAKRAGSVCCSLLSF